MSAAQKPGPGKDDKSPKSGRPEHKEVDESVEETFPASDPPAFSGTTGEVPPPEEEGEKQPS
jgi:hypothetical protein